MVLVVFPRRGCLVLVTALVLGLCFSIYGIYSLIRAAASPTIKDKVIVVDPGHGGRDPGATVDGYYEKDLNLKIARAVYRALEAVGAKPVLTRNSDRDFFPGGPYYGTRMQKRKELDGRIKIAVEAQADLLISIHSNAHRKSSVRGPLTFYYYDSPEGEYLARLVQKELNYLTDPQYHHEATGEAYYLLREAPVLALIIEVGFITNSEDFMLLNNPGYQELIANAIVKGLRAYYGGDPSRGES